jgi:peptidoglycan/xylan/chitin deacetylase (PgdA/CDA1 family)
MAKGKVLLTFDVEEFDLPLEYGLQIGKDEQMETGMNGVVEMEKILTQTDIPSTLFTTANFAEHYPASIKQLSGKNEIASHAFYHSSFEKKDLLESRLTLEKITGTKITGLRMPRFRKIDIASVKEAGYHYDSSMNPTLIPGRYDNRHLPRTIYVEDEIQRVPVSVTPNLRIPLFWLSFKNLPYQIYERMAIQTLKKDGYLSLYFHPWEFTNINKWAIPAYLKKHSTHLLSEKLIRLITEMKKVAEFQTISDFVAENYQRKL